MATQKCNPHVPHIVDGKPCQAEAAAKYTWPTTGKESFICQAHLYWVTNLAQNLGVQVNITVLSAVDPYESANCPAEKCGKPYTFVYLDRGEKAKVRWQKAFVCPEHGEFSPPSKGGAESVETPILSDTDTTKGAEVIPAVTALRVPPLSPVVENGTTHRESPPSHLPECGMIDVEGKEHWLCQTACPIAELWRPVELDQAALKASEWQARLDGDEEYQRLYKEDAHGIGAATRLLWLKKCFDEGRTP